MPAAGRDETEKERLDRALAMSGAILLVTNVIFDTATTIVATAATLGAFAAVSYVLPLRRRGRLRS